MFLGDPSVGMMGGHRDTSYTANAIKGGTGTTPTNYLWWGGAAESYLSDQTSGSLSLWFKIISTAKDPNQIYFFSMAGAQFTLAREDIIGDNSLGDTRMFLSLLFGGSEQFTGKGMYLCSNTKFTASVNPGWHHLLASWDLNHVNTTDLVGQMYIDDIQDQFAGNFPAFGGGFGASSGPHVVNWTEGAGSGSGGPSYPSEYGGSIPNNNVELAELYINTHEFIDFSVQANRRKFRSPNGYPISLGSNGATPTGTAPTYYFKSPAASWGTNSGSGINMLVNGSGQTDVSPPPEQT